MSVTVLRRPATTSGKSASNSPLRCLWIGRHIPYPMDEGAKVYSAKLAQALAGSGAFVRVLGFGAANAPPDDGTAIEWVAVPSTRRGAALAVLSRLPMQAAVDAVPAFVSLLKRQLSEPWDVIVLDGYGTGWALDHCMATSSARATRRPVLVHVSHNDEERLWKSLARESTASLPRRLVLWQNYWKVRSLERRVVSGADILTAITPQDARSLVRHRDDSRALVLTPGYDGPIAQERTIDHRTPRRAVIVGSFQWVVKRENLQRFIERADPLFAQHGIELVVAGHVPDDLRQALVARCRATRFQGFVQDLGPFLSQARIAIVPELLGGGFKLKFLDYFFGRVPVATIAAAAAGLPQPLRSELILRPDFGELASAIVEHIERLDKLNRMQATAFSLASTLYRWQDRGAQLMERIVQFRQERKTAARPLRERNAAQSDHTRS